MYQVDSEDASFIFLDKTDSPTHISLVYLYKPTETDDQAIRFTGILEHIRERFHSCSVLHHKLQRVPFDFDYPYWVDDDNFDINFHIRHLALPKPGDWRQFCIQVSRLNSRQLDLSRPLWECYVIEGLDNVEGFPPGTFAIYFKVHHCAMDEFTAIELMESLHEVQPNPEQDKSSRQKVRFNKATSPSLPQMLIKGGLNNNKKLAKLCLQSMQSIKTLSHFASKLMLRKAGGMINDDAHQVPPTRFGSPISQSRVFEGGFFTAKVLKDYADLVSGATVSNAIEALFSEALRLYLEDKGELPETPLTALLQVNVRNAGAHALTGNHVGLKKIELRTDVCFPIERLQAIVAINCDSHREHENQTATSFELRSVYENIPAPLLSLVGQHSRSKNSFSYQLVSSGNCGIAEMQGSRDTLYLLGAELCGFTSISPLYHGCGLMFTASYYRDEVGLTFTSDRSMMPDPERMRSCIDKAFSEIEAGVEEYNEQRTSIHIANPNNAEVHLS